VRVHYLNIGAAKFGNCNSRVQLKAMRINHEDTKIATQIKLGKTKPENNSGYYYAGGGTGDRLGRSDGFR
jgi:hypothetical protein